MNDTQTADQLKMLKDEISDLLAGVPEKAQALTSSINLAKSTQDPINTVQTATPVVKSVTTAAQSGGSQAVASLLGQLTSPAIGIGGLASGAAGWLRWLSPIASLVSLFGGSDEASSEPAASTSRAKQPEEIFYRRGVQARDGWRVADMDFGGDGRGRTVEPGGTPSQIIVQVQTIDSQSFLDHSDAIADAVKKSILESHGLADALREL